MAPYDRDVSVMAELRLAVRARNIDRLEAILDTVKDSGLNDVLAQEVREARNLLRILRRMMTIRMSLQELKQTMLSDMVDQTSPHKITEAIMTAVMMLLGVEEEYLRGWFTVKYVIGTTPRKQYRFLEHLIGVKSAKVKVADARRALYHVSRFNLDMDRIKGISEALALFYTWLLTLTEEVISIEEAACVE